MSFVTNSLGSVGKTLGNAGNTAKNTVIPQEPQQQQQPQQQPQSAPPPMSTESQAGTGTDPTNQNLKSESNPSSSESESKSPASGGFMSGLGKATTTITSPITSGVSDLAKSGAQLASDVSNAGVSISQSVAKSGLDMSASVVDTGVKVGTGVAGGTVDLAGTALGGIVNTAAETSGKVFEPVASGLKAVEGFDKLGVADGLRAINGLPVAAVQQVGKLSMQALNVSGKTPTFFDTDGDGTVTVSDTIKGLIVLGLDETNSKYAAYALHAVFSFPTGTSWVPTDTNLPITVSNMQRTRWGRNWGQYDRIEWVQDVDINQFFAAADDATWQEKFKKGRQYFGILLLIFEWGTTWPFIMPDVPVDQIPFKDEIGKVVRTLILPTIFSNFQRARSGEVSAGNEPPAKEAPSGPNDA